VAKTKLSKAEKASVRRALISLINQKPWLIREALERGLMSSRPLGYLDLAARLLKEINVQEQTTPKIAIIFQGGGLDANKLKGDVVEAQLALTEGTDAPIAESSPGAGGNA
jgi:hypothetical protein